jgi:hypothetical protein
MSLLPVKRIKKINAKVVFIHCRPWRSPYRSAKAVPIFPGKWVGRALYFLINKEASFAWRTGARNLATIRRYLLNLIKAHPLTDSVAGKMQRASWTVNLERKFYSEKQG